MLISVLKRRPVVEAIAACALVLLVVAVGACGGGEDETTTASTAPEPSTPAPESGTTDEAKLGESLTVGSLRITPTEFRDEAIGVADGSQPKNDIFFAVRMRWENVGEATLTQFPTAAIVNTDGSSHVMGLLADPEPALVSDIADFRIRPGETKEGWLTFDISGTPSELKIYVRSDSSGTSESGTWSLQ